MKLLHPYQAKFIADKSPRVILVKARRIGGTFACACLATMTAMKSKAAGGMNVFFMPKKEDEAKAFIRDVEWFARKLGVVVKRKRPEMNIVDNENKFLKQEINFSSGFKVAGLSSNPKNFRSNEGVAIIDEAGFQDDFDEILKAASSYLIRGGRIITLSTHNGVNTPFNRYVERALAGEINASVHRVTFDDALEQGFFKRECLLQGKTWSPEAEKSYRDFVFAEVGEDADEELLCIPRRAGGNYLSRNSVEDAMSEDNAVVSLVLDDNFPSMGKSDRESQILGWCVENIELRLKAIPDDSQCYIGTDFGRSATGDVSCIAVGWLDGNLVRNIGLIIEMRNVPGSEQTVIFDFVCRHVPTLRRAMMDAAGVGHEMAERAYDQHGEKICRIGVAESAGGHGSWSNVWKLALPAYKEALQKKSIRLPKNADLLTDHLMFTVINGLPKLPDKRYKGISGKWRHGDAAVACMLMHYATRGAETPSWSWLEDLVAS